MTDFSGQLDVDREEAFWSKIDKGKDHECWFWNASVNKDNYGQFWIGHTFVGSHRYAWELTRKCKIPEGKMILHMCDNPRCCNPSHLYCGDALDNARDREKRNPISAFKRASNLKLHEEEIWLIRKLKVVKSKNIYTRYKFPEPFVAKMFKVDQSLIHLIWNSDRWLSLEGTYV